jgi:hypothetical protein
VSAGWGLSASVVPAASATVDVCGALAVAAALAGAPAAEVSEERVSWSSRMKLGTSRCDMRFCVR